jgi:tetratricopeptide (TPR) repeat protein
MSQTAGFGRIKQSLKDWLREAMQHQTGSLSSLMTVLLGGLERAGRLPAVGPICLRWAGFIHGIQGRDAQAIALYQAALDGGVRHSSLHHELAYSLLNAGDARRAETEFRTVLNMVPHAAWPLHGLVRSLLAQGRDTEVVQELLAAARRVPAKRVRDVPFPAYLAPQVLATEARVTALRDLVNSHPEAEHASILLAQVEALRGDGPASASLFRSAGTIRFRNMHNHSAPVASPTFFIIGQAKAGTTALFQYLSRHPAIVSPLVKEPQYWSIYYDLGAAWYESLFPRLPETSGLITGEGSVTYLNDPDAPARVRKKLPHVKLIVLLREPVSRAYSEYWMDVRLGRRKASFEEVIAGELSQLPVCPLDDHAAHNGRFPGVYLNRSAALPHLKRWLSHFPPEQLLILRHEQMAQDLPAVMYRVCRFLGVPPFVPRDRRRHNEGRYPPMAADLKEKLRDWFAPHQEALAEFLASLPEARP